MIRTFHCLSGETSVWSQGFLNQQTAIIHEEDDVTVHREEVYDAIRREAAPDPKS